MTPRPTTLQLGLYGTLTVPDDGQLPSCDDGGTPLLYYSREGTTYCAACASQWDAEPPITCCDAHDEGPPETCEGCGAVIRAASGDPDACEACQDEGRLYAPATYNGDWLARCYRSGDRVCMEHQRWCWRCREVFSPTQFPHHLTGGECRHRRLSPRLGLLVVFPAGMAVEVIERDGWVPGTVVGLTDFGQVTVARDTDRDGHCGDYPSYSVRRRDR